MEEKSPSCGTEPSSTNNVGWLEKAVLDFAIIFL